jgi:hypothetical protein
MFWTNLLPSVSGYKMKALYIFYVLVSTHHTVPLTSHKTLIFNFITMRNFSWFYSVSKRKFLDSTSVRSQPVPPQSSPVSRPVYIVAKGAYWRRSVLPSLRPSAWAWLTPDRFSWNLILGAFMKKSVEKKQICIKSGGQNMGHFALDVLHLPAAVNRR